MLTRKLKYATCKLEKLLNAQESRKFPLLGLQIYLWPSVTLTFDLLTKLRISWPWSLDHLCRFASKLFSKYRVDKFGNRQMNEWMNRRANEHTLPLPASLAWCIDKNYIHNTIQLQFGDCLQGATQQCTVCSMMSQLKQHHCLTTDANVTTTESCYSAAN